VLVVEKSPRGAKSDENAPSPAFVTTHARLVTRSSGKTLQLPTSMKECILWLLSTAGVFTLPSASDGSRWAATKTVSLQSIQMERSDIRSELEER
jgi:hypothetical protein